MIFRCAMKTRLMGKARLVSAVAVPAAIVLMMAAQAMAAGPAPNAGNAASTAKPGQDSDPRYPSQSAVAGQAPVDQVSTGPASAGQATIGPGSRLPDAAADGTDLPAIRWVAYRQFAFGFDRSDIDPAEVSKVAEIAKYMAQNPSLVAGLDGSVALHGNHMHDQILTDRRVGAVRDALVAAGVPADKIKVGEFADPELKRDRQIQVLLGAAN